MARERALPGTSTFIQDFGLNITPEPSVRNKRVVIIGTAEDGPQYEPILIEKPEDAEYVWGRLGAGDLVRGVYESWNVQDGVPNVVGVRIGNGRKATLKVAESSGTGQNTPNADTSKYAIQLEAKFPGSIYNQVTVGYDNNRNIAIYNPKTRVTTTFKVDTQRPNNTAADVHNVSELVDAINTDRNLSSILNASYTPFEADYEIAISGGVGAAAAVLKNSNGQVKLDLEKVIDGSFVVSGANAYMIESPTGHTVTSTNNIIELQSVEAVSISEWEQLQTNGTNSTTLAITPLDGKGTTAWDTIQSLKDYNADDKWMLDPSGNLVSEFVYSLDFDLVDDLPTTASGYVSGGTRTNTFRLTSPLPLDDSEEVLNSGVASGYIDSLFGSTYSSYEEDWTRATTQGIATKEVDGVQVRPSGLIKVYVSDTQDVNGFWQELPYSTTSGVFLKSFANGVCTFGIGSDLTSNVSGVMRKLVDVSGYILPNKYIRVTANSVKGFLNEVETLPELEDAGTTSLQTYFVRGQEILFNRAPEFNIIVNYGTRVKFEPGTSVSLSDSFNGEITFTDPELLPGPGGKQLSADKKSYIRFKYTYMPNFPAFTTAAKTLSGGTNGNKLTESQRREELSKALDNLKNFEGDIWVPMGCYIDSVAERYNPVTGLKEEITAGYHTLLEEFLDDLSINSVQPHAILGVKPLSEQTQAAKNLWVKRLTETDEADPNRGANVMAQLQNKFFSVVAFEPIFPNIGRGNPYSANGQAAYAGLLASLPYDISPTNKSIKNLLNVRFGLAESQYEALNSSRYVAMRPQAGTDPVIINDVTAAPIGSDYTNWSVYSITAEAANRVRAVARTYIGRPNNVMIRNSMEQQISNVLTTMDGLRASDFSIKSSLTQQVLGIIEIDLTLVPVFTIKKIRTTVKLRKTLDVSA